MWIVCLKYWSRKSCFLPNIFLLSGCLSVMNCGMCFSLWYKSRLHSVTHMMLWTLVLSLSCVMVLTSSWFVLLNHILDWADTFFQTNGIQRKHPTFYGITILIILLDHLWCLLATEIHALIFNHNIWLVESYHK